MIQKGQRNTSLIVWRGSRRGFTFVEMLISITITTLAMGLISGILFFLYRTHTATLQQSFAVNSARRGIEQTVRSMREATFSDTGGFPIESFSPSSFTFYSDTDKDNSVEKIRFFLEGTDFKKGTIDATGDPPVYEVGNENIEFVADYVRNDEQAIATFRYYDQQGAEITDFGAVSDVAFVIVSLIVNVNPYRDPGDFTLRSSATLRNLKTNL